MKVSTRERNRIKVEKNKSPTENGNRIIYETIRFDPFSLSSIKWKTFSPKIILGSTNNATSTQ